MHELIHVLLKMPLTAVESARLHRRETNKTQAHLKVFGRQHQVNSGRLRPRPTRADVSQAYLETRANCCVKPAEKQQLLNKRLAIATESRRAMKIYSADRALDVSTSQVDAPE
jgi:hypothetical protein